MSHFHLITTSARSSLCGFKLSASLVASCAQLCLHKRSSLKMPHRGIFFTVGFKSLRILSRPKKTPRRVSHFHLITTSARSALCGFKLSVSLVASCAQLCLHKRSSLKMPHRGIFFTVGFKSLRILGRSKLKAPMKGAFSFGLPEGI